MSLIGKSRCRRMAVGFAIGLVFTVAFVPLGAHAYVLPVASETVARGTSDGFQNERAADGFVNVKREGGAYEIASYTLLPDGDVSAPGPAWSSSGCAADSVRYDELDEDPADEDASCRRVILATLGVASLATSMQDLPPIGVLADLDATGVARVRYEFGDDGDASATLSVPSFGCGGYMGSTLSPGYVDLTAFYERCSPTSEWTVALVNGIVVTSQCYNEFLASEICRATQHRVVVDVAHTTDFSLNVTSRFEDVSGVRLSVQWDCTTDDEEGLDLYVDGVRLAQGVCLGDTAGLVAIPDIGIPRRVDVRLVSPTLEGDVTESTYRIDMLRIEGEFNRPPTADAGPDRSVTKRTLVTLHGNGSDPDGHALSFAWEQVAGPHVDLTGADTADASMAPPQSGAYVFLLTVSDGFGGTAADVVVVTATNEPPVADAGVDRTVSRHTVVELDGSDSSDPDGDTLSFAWQQTSGPSTELANGTTAAPSFLPTEAGSYAFLLVVDDGDGGVATDIVVVVAWGRAPTAVLTATPLTARVGVPVSVDASGSSDPEGTLSDYRFDFGDGTVLQGPSPRASHAYAVAGDHTIVLTATDGDGNASTDAVTVSILPNAAPAADAQVWPATGFIGAPLLFSAANSSDDMGIMRYEWDFGDGMTASGAIARHAFLSLGMFEVRLRVTDGEGATDESTLRVTVVNRPPKIVFTGPASPSAIVGTGERRTFAVSAADQDRQALAYSWTVDGIPEGLDLPAFEFVRDVQGTYVVNVTVSDGVDASSYEWIVVVETGPAEFPWVLVLMGIVAAFVAADIGLRVRRAQELSRMGMRRPRTAASIPREGKPPS